MGILSEIARKDLALPKHTPKPKHMFGRYFGSLFYANSRQLGVFILEHELGLFGNRIQ
jgi:hypothetical protein